MSSIGHPLLGDDVYGSGKSPYNITGQALHARAPSDSFIREQVNICGIRSTFTGLFSKDS